ncbi:Eco57I restriction-modification methylase domain-containing protein [Flavobacterium gawalongense]|uniref:site-specific DNA-methyltransferase (adenine-specific) n=1 Tax=Flavobacterium gawalongense TaxID=2594432 RepID=A0ABY3CIJ7_9FLAO|nr:N-6 DNA methylase [Flavobacterium gawalongense]TRX00112.1 N-6 DNA methylase [Flavobacterium gawalongense]TRX04795.1 N-6 DNA methylase [Flavobacterium gawalongense]
MSLFQPSVLKKYLSQQDSATVQKAYKKYSKYFHNPTIQENIRNSKEEQFQEGFLRELFVDILGYTLNPAPTFNLTTELKNIKGAKKVDGAILKDGNALGVIELKGTNTKDLESIRQQAFDYKANQTGCIYVITSNFEKLRFYINNAVDYEEFNLFTLTHSEFEMFYLCLAKDNILANKPLTIKEASVLEEENITKHFYADYSLFKRELYRDLVKQNRNNVMLMELSEKTSKLTLFKKSQKLIDRFLFILFAEDRGLLSPNSISTILKEWKALEELDMVVPLYDRYKQYFGYLDTGRKGTDKKEEIFAYNGGLFQPDVILDAVIIDDDLLYRHTKKLTTYDFESQVDVNILGHIFEHSLNEIESVNAEIEGTDFDKQKTKRKKDGVFYTPKYITKYIVDNTIGKLCTEKKQELSIIDEEYAKGRKNRQATTIVKLDQQLKDYREWLLELTICDPACGSGAFLNQALDFLIKEHAYIDELNKQLFGGGFTFPDIENQILEHNIYGVDLNEESIEIAKLSLWLRTAQPKRKLTSLNNNIKCGNSLIDSKAIAGDKAFNWKEQFPEVFDKGGFDVIIGNPPYVRQELFKDIKPYLEKNYECYNSIADLYTYFIEKGIQLMNTRGRFSFILPNKFLKATYGNEVRKVIKNKVQIDLIFDFDDYPVFKDATTYPMIYIFSKEINRSKSTFIFSEINKRDNTNDPIGRLEEKATKASYNSLKDDNWQFQDSTNDSLLTKIKTGSICLKEIVNDKIFRGVSTGKNEVFIINKQLADKLRNDRNEKFIREIVTGKEVKRYNLNFDNLYLLYIPWEYDLEFDQGIKEYLLANKDILSNRPEVKDGRFNWWCLSRYGSKNAEYLFKSKIIYPRINNESNFFFDAVGNFSLSDNNFFISTDEKYLMPILNSKIVFYFLKSIASTLQGGYLDFRRPYMEIIPIKIPENQKPFIEKFDSMLILNKDLQVINRKFTTYFSGQYKIEKLTKKLENWHELTFAAFITEINKAIKTSGQVPLTKKDEFEWLDLFEENKNKAQTLKSEINKTDKEIDTMVYELYGLSEEEILIVEEK